MPFQFAPEPMKKLDKKVLAAILTAAALFMYGAVIVKMSNRTQPLTAPSAGDARTR